MSDYIKREDAIKIINQYIGTDPIAERVEKDIPAADVEPVRHGKWITYTSGKFSDVPILPLYDCSICHLRTVNNLYKYCPNCGAKMDGDK